MSAFKYRIDIHAWRLRHEGRYITHNGTEGYNMPLVEASDGTRRRQAQCVNQPNSYRAANGLSCSLGNAADWLPANLQCSFHEDSIWIPNRPGNSPSAGDTIVFIGGPYDPEFGHTGSARHGSTAGRLCALWQNDPEFGPDVAVVVSYVGVQGWWSPK